MYVSMGQSMDLYVAVAGTNKLKLGQADRLTQWL